MKVPSLRRVPLRLKVAFLLAALLLLCLAIPGDPLRPCDVRTGEPLEGWEVSGSPARRLLEPPVGLAEYFSRASHWGGFALSWALWLAGLVVLFSLVGVVRRGRGSGRWVPLKRLPVRLLRAVVLLAVWAAYCLLAPHPSLRLVPPAEEDWILFGVESHTYHSHDGLVSPRENIHWHLSHGFDACAITEHRSIGGGKEARELCEQEGYPLVVLAGQEVKTIEEPGLSGLTIYYLIFPLKRWINTRYGTDEPAAYRERARGLGAYVVASPKWRGMKDKIDRLPLQGVQGVEVYNWAHPPESESELARLVCRVRELDLPAMAAMDYHGWGDFCWAWTAIRFSGWKALDREQREAQLLEILGEGDQSRFLPVILRRACRTRPGRSYWEPWIGLALYFTGLDGLGIGCWLAWIVAGTLVVGWSGKSRRRTQKVLLAGWTIAAIFLLATAVQYYLRWKDASGSNRILPEVVMALWGVGCAILAVSWLRFRGTRATQLDPRVRT